MSEVCLWFKSATRRLLARSGRYRRNGAPREGQKCLARSAAAWLALFSVLAAAPAAAGPPFVTDDAGPQDVGTFEILLFADTTLAPGGSSTTAGLDIGYGLAPNLQFTFVAPIEIEHGPHGLHGMGDIELGVGYRVVEQREGSWVPDIAIKPTITLPTAQHDLGLHRVGGFISAWASKDIGDWSMFGGGGYGINPGAGNKDFALAGFALTRQVSEEVNLGVEVYHQSADVVGGPSITRAALGATWQFDEKVALIFSGGPGLNRPRETGRYAFFFGIMFTP